MKFKDGSWKVMENYDVMENNNENNVQVVQNEKGSLALQCERQERM